MTWLVKLRALYRYCDEHSTCASYASSLLEVDVVLPVIMQRQVLAALYRITWRCLRFSSSTLGWCGSFSSSSVVNRDRYPRRAPVLGQGVGGPGAVQRQVSMLVGYNACGHAEAGSSAQGWSMMAVEESKYFLQDAGLWTICFNELLVSGSHLCLGEAPRTWQSLVRRVSLRLLLKNFFVSGDGCAWNSGQ